MAHPGTGAPTGSPPGSFARIQTTKPPLMSATWTVPVMSSQSCPRISSAAVSATVFVESIHELEIDVVAVLDKPVDGLLPRNDVAMTAVAVFEHAKVSV